MNVDDKNWLEWVVFTIGLLLVIGSVVWLLMG